MLVFFIYCKEYLYLLFCTLFQFETFRFVILYRDNCFDVILFHSFMPFVGLFKYCTISAGTATFNISLLFLYMYVTLEFCAETLVIKSVTAFEWDCVFVDP